jgi:hypothetical protein
MLRRPADRHRRRQPAAPPTPTGQASTYTINFTCSAVVGSSCGPNPTITAPAIGQATGAAKLSVAKNTNDGAIEWMAGHIQPGIRRHHGLSDWCRLSQARCRTLGQTPILRQLADRRDHPVATPIVRANASRGRTRLRAPIGISS